MVARIILWSDISVAVQVGRPPANDGIRTPLYRSKGSVITLPPLPDEIVNRRLCAHARAGGLSPMFEVAISGDASGENGARNTAAPATVGDFDQHETMHPSLSC